MKRSERKERGVDNEREGSEPEKIHETRSLGQGYSQRTRQKESDGEEH